MILLQIFIMGQLAHHEILTQKKILLKKQREPEFLNADGFENKKMQ